MPTLRTASADAESAASPGGGELRGVWASSLGPALDSEEEVADLARSVRASGLNAMVIQVRRNGTVYYRSDLEPRAPAIVDQPRYDALETALRIARDPDLGRRLDVYAWFNVFPVSRPKGLREAAKPTHLSDAHPDWYTLDEAGERKPFLDPAVPGARDHFVALVEECLQRYPVDGINLDFIRYPETGGGYHPVALERFARETGRDDRPANDDPEWGDFRRRQVTSLLRRLALSVRRIRPEAVLTIDAVGFGSPGASFEQSAPYTQVFQDWAGWTEEGIVDVCCRMGYKREHIPNHARMFRDWADFSEALQARSGRVVSLGIGGFFNEPDATIAQYREAVNRGLGTCLFSYHRPTAEAQKTGEYGPASPFWERLRRDVYTDDVPPPRPVWRRDRATVGGRILPAEGRRVDGARVRLEPGGREQIADVDGWFAFIDIPPGPVRISVPDAGADPVQVQAVAGRVALAEVR